MTAKQIKDYIINDLECDPKHNCEALSKAINDVSHELLFDPFRIMQLLLTNRPIDELHTHSYGFQTENGRKIIDKLIDKYYEYESNS